MDKSSRPQPKPSLDDSSTKTTSSARSSAATTDAEVYSWRDLAKDVGKEFGKTLGDKEADNLLWNHTGFPSFFQTDPVEQCRAQLRSAFRRVDL